MYIFSSGLRQIQGWLKESLRTKPFCLAVKDWMKNPNWSTQADVRDVLTALTLKLKFRTSDKVREEELDDMTKLFDDKLYPDEKVKRILVTGLHFIFSDFLVHQKLHAGFLEKLCRRTFLFQLCTQDLSLHQEISDGSRKYPGLITRPHQKSSAFVASFVHPCTIILSSQGVGKSTTMKHLALSWADGTSPELSKFDFVFHIALRFVKDARPLEDVIVGQHSALKGNDVAPEEVKNILSGRTKSKVLLLLDGYDEYKEGTNANIDDALKKQSAELLVDSDIARTTRHHQRLEAIRWH